MIPKILHYIWLGQGPLGSLGERCLESWHRHLPGWEIRKWHEGNSPMDHPFVGAMMERKLYAFASDYIRLEALLRHGGLYLDADTELVADPTPFIKHGGLTVGLLSLQNRLSKCSLATNFLAACVRNPVLRIIQERYDKLNRATMNNTLFTAAILPLFRNHDIPRGRTFEFFEEAGIRIYHPDFFNPIRQEEEGKTVPEAKARSVAIHYGTGAWFGKQDPEPLWRRLADLRPDRALLRPMEKKFKAIFRKTRPAGAGVKTASPAIPRIIHYVWLGQAPLSGIGRRCLESWRKHLPGWEIRRWDETNSPVGHPFVKKMLLEKKYAFASDYIRLFALAQEGGLYLDTDLELIGDVTPLLQSPCVLAFLSAQNRPSKNSAAMGFFASVPRHPWVLELRDMYDRLDLAIMNTTLTTRSLQKRGMKSLDREPPDNDFWNIGDIRIYHSDYFYPPEDTRGGYKLTPRTLGIHHAEGSWSGQAAPISFWQKVKDSRLDRKILRPIEKFLKGFWI